MRYRSLPKIPGLEISALGLGCMRLPTVGNDPAEIDEEKALALLHAAVDAGVNYFDTAYPYHGGQSEPFVGRALRSGLRDRVQLATKLPVWNVQSEADWERLLDEQLERLSVDRIDFYLLHALSASRWETVQRLHGLEALERARADGRIGHIGFSFHDSLETFQAIIDGYDWAFCQTQLNFLDTDFQAGLAGLDYATQRGIGTIVMEPLRGGGLAANLPEPVRALWARSPLPRSPAQWALRWVLDQPGVVCALSGMNDPSQLQENAAVASDATVATMSTDERALVEEVAAFYRARMRVPCTTCGYCQPCPNGVSISETFSTYNSCVMFDSRRFASFYLSSIVASGAGADACIACRECLEKCPQGIEIPDRLEEAHAFLSSP